MKASLLFAMVLFLPIGLVAAASGAIDSVGRLSLQKQGISKIEPSGLYKKVVRFSRQHPRATAKEITAYANSLLAKSGFDYEFETLYFIRKHGLESVISDDLIYQYRLEQIGGEPLTLQSRVEDGMCSELFAYLPTFRVTKSEMVLAIDGKPRRFVRPPDFGLDEMELVDSTSPKAKVIRRWEAPEQTIPAGISADGKTLYTPADFDRSVDPGAKINNLSVLAISSSGLRFEVAADALKGQKTEDIYDFPKDPNNSYLAFRKFRVAGRTYIIRYVNLCT